MEKQNYITDGHTIFIPDVSGFLFSYECSEDTAVKWNTVSQHFIIIIFILLCFFALMQKVKWENQ